MIFSKIIESVRKTDQGIWFVYIALSIISMLTVYSSTRSIAFRLYDANTEYYLIRHTFMLLVGIGVAYLIQTVNHKHFSSVSKISMVLSIILLFLTLILGESYNEAKRWLTIPIVNMSFQTSDFAKLAIIMYVSRTLAVNQGVIKNFKEGYLPLILPLGIVVLLIVFSNMSTAIILLATNLVIMLMGRVNIKYILQTMLFGAIAIGIAVGISYMNKDSNKSRYTTWENRIKDFKNSNPENPNYQTLKANIAIASGGLVRFAPGKCKECNFLPEAYSDFIFATIIEEYGLVGAAFVMFLYLFLLHRVIRIVRYSPRIFSALMALGLGVSIVMQAFINMGVAVGLLPVTGLTLPFISMGGTSTLFNSVAIGIILSVSRFVKESTPAYSSSNHQDLQTNLNV